MYWKPLLSRTVLKCYFATSRLTFNTNRKSSPDRSLERLKGFVGDPRKSMVPSLSQPSMIWSDWFEKDLSRPPTVAFWQPERSCRQVSRPKQTTKK